MGGLTDCVTEFPWSGFVNKKPWVVDLGSYSSWFRCIRQTRSLCNGFCRDEDYHYGSQCHPRELFGKWLCDGCLEGFSVWPRCLRRERKNPEGLLWLVIFSRNVIDSCHGAVVQICPWLKKAAHEWELIFFQRSEM